MKKLEINIVTGGLGISAIIIGKLMEDIIITKEESIRIENIEYREKMIPIGYSIIGIA